MDRKRSTLSATYVDPMQLSLLFDATHVAEDGAGRYCFSTVLAYCSFVSFFDGLGWGPGSGCGWQFGLNRMRFLEFVFFDVSVNAF